MTARFHADELERVELAAGAAGLTTSAYVSRCAVKAAEGMPAPRAISAHRAARVELLRPLNRLHAELRAVGNNVNQLARAANTTGAVPPDLVSVRRELHDVLSAITAAIVRATVEDEP